MPSDYRLARALRVRLWGACLVGLGLLVFLAAIAVVTLELPSAALSAAVGTALLGVVTVGLLLARGAAVVNLDEAGYRVSLVRGAGVHRARWKDVEDVVIAYVAGERCVVLRLRDGGSTTVPLRMLEADPDSFVRDLHEHLDRGHGYRRIR